MSAKMNKNIHELVDFERLKKANDTWMKWLKYFGVPQKKYQRFILNIKKSPENFKKDVAVNYRSQFSKDLKTMFYAGEVEEILIKQYHALVLYVLKRMRVAFDRYDEMITDGFLAIRSATWQYRTHKIKASFTTFVHNAIFCKFKGKLHKEKLKRQRNQKFSVSVVSDYDKGSLDIEQYSNNKDYTANTEDIYQMLEAVIAECNLTDKEATILRCFANRKVDQGLWYAEYLEKFRNDKLNKPYSRQSVFNQLEIVHRKVFEHLKNKNMVPEGYNYAASGVRRDFR